MDWIQDLRHGARVFRRVPVPAGAAMLTLGLGIGATACIFSILRAVLLEPLPSSEVDRRVAIWSRWKDFDKTWLSDAEVLELSAPPLHGRGRRRLVAGPGKSHGRWRSRASRPRPGDGERFLGPGDGATLRKIFHRGRGPPGGPEGRRSRKRSLEEALRKRPEGTRPDGPRRRRSLHRGGDPEGGLSPSDRLQRERRRADGDLPSAPNRRERPLPRLARLLRGGSAFARRDRRGGERGARKPHRELHRRRSLPRGDGVQRVRRSLEEEILGAVRPAVLLVAVAVALLLLISCANVANLLLASGEGRQREMAVRSALGAGARRLVRQLLTEGLLLAFAAFGAGLFLAWGGVRAARSVDPAVIPRASDVQIDFTVVAFTGVLALATAVLFSLVPALRAARVDLVSSLREGSARTGTSREGFRSTLVAAEMALAAVLLVGAGLMIRSLQELRRIELGFEPDNVLTLRVSLPAASYESSERVVQFYGDLLARTRALPGVVSAGAVRSLPLASPIGDWGVDVEGYVESPGDNAKGDWQVATHGASEALSERLISGRLLAATDTLDSQPVALVNQTMAKRYWGGTDPVGRLMRMGSSDPDRPWLTVVGVVSDEKHTASPPSPRRSSSFPTRSFIDRRDSPSGP